MSRSRVAPRRRLTNVQVFEAVERFLRTGNPRHLPAEFRHEADGIYALFVRETLAASLISPPPWPASAARPHPGAGASLGDEMRALMGDRADEDSGLSS